MASNLAPNHFFFKSLAASPDATIISPAIKTLSFPTDTRRLTHPCLFIPKLRSKIPFPFFSFRVFVPCVGCHRTKAPLFQSTQLSPELLPQAAALSCCLELPTRAAITSCCPELLPRAAASSCRLELPPQAVTLSSRLELPIRTSDPSCHLELPAA